MEILPCVLKRKTVGLLREKSKAKAQRQRHVGEGTVTPEILTVFHFLKSLEF